MFLRTQVILAGNHVLAPKALRESNYQALALIIGMRLLPGHPYGSRSHYLHSQSRQVLTYRSEDMRLI